jgi:predicted transporter
MTGIGHILLISGISTGLGLGFVVWGVRATSPLALYVGAGLLLHGIALLGFYLVWTYSPFTR